MSYRLSMLKVLTCVAVGSIAAASAYADSSTKPTQSANGPNCVPGSTGCMADPTSATDPKFGAPPYDQYDGPNCTPNLPNCYTYEPSRNLTKNNPTKSPTK
jgi:hypothetical protein